MKTYEVKGTLIKVVKANDGAEAIRKVEEEQTHGEMLNMSAIEVESPKEEFLREISEFSAEFKRLEKKYDLVSIDTEYEPNTFEPIISVGLSNEMFFDILGHSDMDVDKSLINGSRSEHLSTIQNGVEYHTVVLRK